MRQTERDVVLVHGIPGAAAAWRRTEAALGSQANVVVPDLVGFGVSTVDRPTVENVGLAAQVAAITSLLDTLDVHGAVMAGHDFGVPISILVAHRRPDLVSRLVLLAGNAFPDTPVPFPLSLTTAPVVAPVAQRLLFSGPSLRLMLRQGTGPGSEPPDAGTYLGPASQQQAIATIFASALTRLAATYAPVEAALRSLTVPVVVGWGDHDPFFDVEQGRRTAQAAGARLQLFAGAGHFLPHERPEEVASLIAEG